jgi:outer membrane protein
MKKILKVLSATVILALAIIGIFHSEARALAAQQSKIGIVDTRKAVFESESGKRAKTNFESFIKDKEAKIEVKRKQAETLKEEFQKQITAMSEDAKKKKEEEIQRLMRELQRMAEDGREEVRKKEAELFGGIVKDIHEIVEALGKEDGYSVILEKGAVAFSDASVDITPKVISKYNDAGKKK